jgi:hypothetical protein
MDDRNLPADRLEHRVGRAGAAPLLGRPQAVTIAIQVVAHAALLSADVREHPSEGGLQDRPPGIATSVATK